MRHIRSPLLVTVIAATLIGCADNPVKPIDEYARYNIIIERHAINEFERQMISMVEAAYPDREEVLALVLDDLVDAVPEKGYWWYDKHNDFRIPYSITNETIELH